MALVARPEPPHEDRIQDSDLVAAHGERMSDTGTRKPAPEGEKRAARQRSDRSPRGPGTDGFRLSG